ncbi:MAG TPA: trehalose-phosphatase [Xanthobacteraceae bacterium]|jgi:trehalose 6-phosphate phosphatase|nr:trehalose-phosphatase [Xanthobacteraceae bacterium]
MKMDEPHFTPDLRKSALLLDVDGTIVDIAPKPDAVRVPASLKDSLSRLVAATDGAVALVSGRLLADLDRLFTPLHLAVVGGHGAELRLLDAGKARALKSLQLDPELKRRLSALARDGVSVEDKGFSLALHYRQAPEQEKHLRAAVAEVCAEEWSPAVEILPGKAVFEIKPAGFTKATGVRALMKHAPFAGRRPIFIGDDTTDETVFAIMPEFDGTAFSVGRDVAGVAGRFATPARVRAWLDRIAPAHESVAP